MNQFKKFLRKYCSVLIVGGFLLAIITGCSSQNGESVNALFSPTPSLTETPTVIWFPSTATPTFADVNTSTPNPAASPAFGTTLFSDTFETLGAWLNSQDANGNVIVKGGAITLAVKSSKGSLFSFRQDTDLSDFYLETTASVSLCKEDDQIGVLFREQGAQSYYRVVISCQGTIALQQVVGSTPTFLSNWSPSAEIQPGLWKPLKIGVWAYGKLMRIYVNDQLQAEVTRDTFKDGAIGFYARAAADTPLTVSFSQLTVYKVMNEPSSPVATTSATP
jgi:hypothetical protein